MTTSAPPAPAFPRPRRTRRSRLVPHQHGAWAFLVLPLVMALPVAGISWVWTLLLVGWVSAYPASWALTGLLSGPRPERFRRGAAVWVPPTAAIGAFLAWQRPWLLVVGLAYCVVFGVHLAYARRRNERALLNDLVLVLECAVMVPVTVGVVAGGRSWTPPAATWSTDAGLLAVACALALASSVLHVKSRIRERRNPRYAAAARWFAVGCVPVVAGLAVLVDAGAWLALPFVALAARTWLVPGDWRPARVGLVELACFVALAASAWSV